MYNGLSQSKPRARTKQEQSSSFAIYLRHIGFDITNNTYRLMHQVNKFSLRDFISHTNLFHCVNYIIAYTHLLPNTKLAKNIIQQIIRSNLSSNLSKIIKCLLNISSQEIRSNRINQPFRYTAQRFLSFP